MSAAPKFECCGGRCRWCDRWQIKTVADLPSKFCEACRAVVYVDIKGRCIPCGDER